MTDKKAAAPSNANNEEKQDEKAMEIDNNENDTPQQSV